jgi:hypothetical protein
MRIVLMMMMSGFITCTVAQINVGNITNPTPTDIIRTPEQQAKYEAQIAKNKACHEQWAAAHPGAVNSDPNTRRAFISACAGLPLAGPPKK